LSKKFWFFGFLFVLAGAALVLAPLPVRTAPTSQRILRVEASQFAYLPAVLLVNPGDTVTIELVSTDVVHGLYLDGYGISVTADPGQTARLTFKADKPGSFRFRCNVTCGALHPFMIGKLQVGPNTLLWRAIALTVLAALAILILRPNLPKAQTG
jgi:heme/copper-type cytochrome/quinol oxidase subunit 2